MAADDATAKPAREPKDGGADGMRYLVTVSIAVLLLIAFGLLVYYLNQKASGEAELVWQRQVYLFGGVEAIVFTAVGWIFGREVNRQQVDKAENRADESDQRADAAIDQASTANEKAADLAARGLATKAAILARHDTLADTEGDRTRSVYGDKAGAASAEFDELVKFVTTLYPD